MIGQDPLSNNLFVSARTDGDRLKISVWDCQRRLLPIHPTLTDPVPCGPPFHFIPATILLRAVRKFCWMWTAIPVTTQNADRFSAES